MKLLLRHDYDAYPVLIGDIESAHISYSFDGKERKTCKVNILCSNQEEAEFKPSGFDEISERHCILFIEYVAQELKRGTPLIEVDESVGFQRRKNGEIIALQSIPFGDVAEEIEDLFV